MIVYTVNCFGVEFKTLTFPEYPDILTSLFFIIFENPNPFTIISPPFEEISFELRELINGIILA